MRDSSSNRDKIRQTVEIIRDFAKSEDTYLLDSEYQHGLDDNQIVDNQSSNLNHYDMNKGNDQNQGIIDDPMSLKNGSSDIKMTNIYADICGSIMQNQDIKNTKDIIEQMNNEPSSFKEIKKAAREYK